VKVPISYSFRNLWTRRLTTVLTAAGLALVVFVYATVLMMSEGLRKTLVTTGSYDNVIVTRKGSGAEVQSGVERAQAAIVESAAGVSANVDGTAAVSKELVVLITLMKESSGVATNVVIRGVGQEGLRLRPQIKVNEGRLFRPGSSEIIAGRSITERFPEAALGGTLRFGQRDWTIVGIFDANKTGFDSEVWGDVDQLMQAFRRPVYSSMLLKLNDPGAFEHLKDTLEGDPRLTLDVKRETVYYAEQSEALATFINILGLALSVIFSIGATLGAMITMYAAVANRTQEIGTLRALGFKKSSVLVTFLLESIFLSLLGGAVGLAFASLMQFLTISTLNWQTFAELAFTFTLTPGIAAQSIFFAIVMGVLGGVLPAARAARMKIVDSLRAA
jgi:putative ABC transport system permease protein